MRLTNYSDYALRTLMFLAVMPDADELVTISDIANSYQISKSHLTKIVHQLAKLGYIESVRGKNGGIRLAKPAKDINLGEIVRHTEAGFAVVPCLRLSQYILDSVNKGNEVKQSGANTQALIDDECVMDKSVIEEGIIEKDVACSIQPMCLLKSVFSEAVLAFIGVMDNYTLADIIKNKEDLKIQMAFNTYKPIRKGD